MQARRMLLQFVQVVASCQPTRTVLHVLVRPAALPKPKLNYPNHFILTTDKTSNQQINCYQLLRFTTTLLTCRPQRRSRHAQQHNQHHHTTYVHSIKVKSANMQRHERRAAGTKHSAYHSIGLQRRKLLKQPHTCSAAKAARRNAYSSAIIRSRASRAATSLRSASRPSATRTWKQAF